MHKEVNVAGEVKIRASIQFEVHLKVGYDSKDHHPPFHSFIFICSSQKDINLQQLRKKYVNDNF